jgi:hypothetical protein
MLKLWFTMLAGALLFWRMTAYEQAAAEPTLATPLIVERETKKVQIFGVIYPARFNAAQGDEAHYHFLVWQGGTSASTLIETPADDLAFYDALIALGAQPGENLTMASWNERHNRRSLAPLEKVIGASLEVRIAWASNPDGIPIDRVFHQSTIHNPQSAIEWRFGGNRNRWFNRIPLAPRPGCLACLYSCPSGKVSNGALSIHDYVTAPSRFLAKADILPPDGTPVIVTFRVQP